ncbi:MAG TPA: TetR/AcrR family transcriptional regulator [Nevskia sp.]|nr:TetR/AcrR family transcriptional regulator [Nevskia sp.]
MPKKNEAEVLGRQALKTKRTRESLINATISLIKEGGFAAASSSRIAERAGMTWGAAQHHFGSKEDILNAILALSYERFIETMAAPGLDQGSMEQRVGGFVDRMWTHYQSDWYRVSLEILLATREGTDHADRAWEVRQGKAHLKVVRQVFHDSRLSDVRIQEVLTFTHCCLSGLSIEGIFETQVKNLSRHLQRIKQAMLAMLQGN